MDIVPSMAKAPRRTPMPVISIQLPSISEKAATYDRVTGKGKCRGLTKASAKLLISDSFS